MLKHLYFTILLTFIVGVATGVYAYFLTREHDSSTLGTTEIGDVPSAGYEIVAYTYGGCERVGCASLRITDDGAYTYLVNTRGGEYERFSDVLTDRQRERLTELMNDTSFETISETAFVGTCPVTYDGIAYRFTLRNEDEQYTFDSCVESLEDRALFAELMQYFTIMDATYLSPFQGEG
jgi:hypothetical protein